MKTRIRVGLAGCFAMMMAVVLWGCGGYTQVGDSLSSGNNGSSSTGDGSSSGGATLTALHSAPKDLSVGDVMMVDLGDSNEIAIDFTGVSSSSKFILAVGSYNQTGATTAVQLSPDVAAPEVDPLSLSKAMETGSSSVPDEDAIFGPQEELSAWLRANEAQLPPMPAAQNGIFKSEVVKAMSVGDVDTFRVLSNLSSMNSYVEVRGSVRCVQDSVVFYVDDTVRSLDDSDISTLCTEFNRVAAEEQSMLGNISDVNGDGKLQVLFTSQVNKLGALGGGVVTGYFYAGDLYPQSDQNPVSNHREIIYVMVPDDAGQYGYAITKDFAMQNLIPAVLPHELQHAINYNQHVLVRGGQAEDNWLNEGLSHLSEDLMGHNRENPSRYSLYLASPSTYGFITQSSPNLMERGAAYLFLRFLYEQAPDKAAFMKAIEQTSLHGVANIEAAFAGPTDMQTFKEFMSRWVVALAMTDRGISQDSRFIYEPRTRDSATGEWDGVLIDGDANDGRGTVLTGVNLNPYTGNNSFSVDGSTAKFYNVSTVPAQITIAGSSGGGNFGALIRYQ